MKKKILEIRHGAKNQDKTKEQMEIKTVFIAINKSYSSWYITVQGKPAFNEKYHERINPAWKWIQYVAKKAEN